VVIDSGSLEHIYNFPVAIANCMKMVKVGGSFFIFNMANNHMGDVKHGLRITREMHAVTQKYDFRIAFKFQLRTIPDFIHPHFRDRMDIKYVKRFSETSLSLSPNSSSTSSFSIILPFLSKDV